jgi:hypothetical protein
MAVRKQVVFEYNCCSQLEVIYLTQRHLTLKVLMNLNVIPNQHFHCHLYEQWISERLDTEIYIFHEEIRFNSSEVWPEHQVVLYALSLGAGVLVVEVMLYEKYMYIMIYFLFLGLKINGKK